MSRPKKNRPKAETAAPFTWTVQTQIVLVASRTDRRLAVAISPHPLRRDRWAAVAAETSGLVKSIDDFFDDHAHQNIGEFPTLPTAVRAAEVFAKRWQKKVAPPASPCPCVDIRESTGASDLACSSAERSLRVVESGLEALQDVLSGARTAPTPEKRSSLRVRRRRS